MIHATVHGVLAQDANYIDARHEGGQSRQAIATFTIAAEERSGVQRNIVCRIRGQRATSLAPHFVAGKRVIVSGALRFPTDTGPVRLDVDRCELVGGTYTTLGEGTTNAV